MYLSSVEAPTCSKASLLILSLHHSAYSSHSTRTGSGTLIVCVEVDTPHEMQGSVGLHTARRKLRPQAGHHANVTAALRQHLDITAKVAEL